MSIEQKNVSIDAALPAGTNNIGDVDIANEPSVNLQDGAGNDISSTAGALDVNIASGTTIEVNLDPANDGVEIYGSDDGGTTQRVVKTDAAGDLQVDILSSALPTGAATEATLGGVALETGGNLATIAGDTTSIDGKTPALGQALMAASVPVAMASNQSAVTVDGSGVTQPVSAASLPLPTGASTEATLASVKTAVEVIDDWDETDRAKVNAVVGQAGLAAGTGLDAANALRVSLATDVALPAGTNNIGDVDIASALPAGSNNIGDVDIASALPAGSNNIGDVDIASAPTGASAIEIQGPAADGASAVGDPVQIGGVDPGGLIQAVASDATGQIRVVPNSGLPVSGTDATGQATYATVVTAPARVCHYLSISVGAEGCIISADGGTTDHWRIPANSDWVFEGLQVAASAAIQAKNLTGSNYSNLHISVW